MPDSFDYTTGTNSENVRLLQALIDDAPEYTEETNSRNANILKSIINNTEYTDAPQSEIEELLLRLKAKIGGEIEVDELNVTENGTYDAGVNKAYNPVTVELPLSSKTITENGTYTASDDNLAGFDEVVVNVPTPPDSYQLKSLPTGAISTITDGSNLPMPSLKIGIEPVQAGSGDPSPTNVRPISGWSAVNVTRCGKNFFKVGSLINQTTAGVTYTSDDNHLIMNGTKSGGSNVTFQNFSITLKAGTYYVKPFAISGSVSKINQSFNLMEGNTSIVVFDFTGEYSFVLTEDKTLNLRTTIWEDGIVYTDYTIGIVISNTPNIEQFEPYNGTTYTTQLKDGQGNPLTCYGGELSNVNGVQTLTNEQGINNIKDLTWSSDDINPNTGMIRFVAQANPLKKNGTSNLISNVFQTKSSTGYDSDTTESISGLSGGSGVYVVINSSRLSGDLTTSAGRNTAFKTWAESVGAVLVYELATPQTIPQDNLAIATQEGTNNLWADSGDVLEGSYFKSLN